MNLLLHWGNAWGYMWAAQWRFEVAFKLQCSCALHVLSKAMSWRRKTEGGIKGGASTGGTESAPRGY
jgi:hypothetical protein